MIWTHSSLFFSSLSFFPLYIIYSTLAYLFGRRDDEDESDSQPIPLRKIGRGTFKHETGIGQDHMEKHMRRKCDCTATLTKYDMILDELQLFRLGDTNKKSSLKNSASRVLKQFEMDMSTKTKAAGRPNVMTKWLDTRYDKPIPEDYEFRHCLQSMLSFDSVEKVYAIDDVTSEHGEPALDQIFLSTPHVKHLRPRRNAFGAVQLCPHSMNTIIGKKGEGSKRQDHVIDVLTNAATMNQELIQPRAGTRRAESLYYESMFNNITRA